MSSAATGRITDRSRLLAELMSAKIAVVPPTSTLVPGGATACRSPRRWSWTRVIASLDAGFTLSSRLNRATVPSAALTGGCTPPTPGTLAAAAANWSS